MLTYPEFYEFEKNKPAVINFLENMPILKNGNRSIALEPEFFAIKPIVNPRISPSCSFWNLTDGDDENLQIPKNNRRYFSDLQEYSYGNMEAFLGYKCKKKELCDWILPTMENETISSKVRNSLYDRNDDALFEIVWADLEGIIASLIIYGESNDFTGGVEGDEYKLYCKIRKAYYAGGYPYGWTDDYPANVKVLVHYDN